MIRGQNPPYIRGLRPRNSFLEKKNKMIRELKYSASSVFIKKEKSPSPIEKTEVDVNLIQYYIEVGVTIAIGMSSLIAISII